MIEPNTRVRVNRFGGSEWAGQYGTVVRAEHPAVLTGRPSVEVALDGGQVCEVFYVSEVDEVTE